MIRHSLAKRYARGLFDVGEKDGNYAAYLDDLNRLLGLMEKEAKLKSALMLPIVEMEKRKDLLGDVLKLLSLAPATASLLQILLDRNRLGYLAMIRDVYGEFVDAKEGRINGVVYSAYPLNEETKTRIEGALGERLKRKVLLQPMEDRTLIGGVKVIVGDLRIDGTIRRQLEILNESMVKE